MFKLYEIKRNNSCYVCSNDGKFRVEVSVGNDLSSITVCLCDECFKELDNGLKERLH